ncbi:acetate--CoA ligase family protein [uncultured Amaricoccus sp.]|uniref:bifunctional acetate--CoA ligase family protein/GNAT family N-acetyltransferase n=1 Tax=uncultured Amaricoccus sp. TaxID=339341 RepID=UPI00261455C1|nr:acetate--CoA ligase family protein [uncultured Amaricoccus sp.]
MTVRNLDFTLHPRSVAVVGASDRPGSVGAVVMGNILSGGFPGPVWPVNPKHGTVAGLPCFADVADLPEAPDLAVVLSPAAGVPEIIDGLGDRGCRVAVVATSGITRANGLRQRMLEAARPYILRVIGPDSVGLIVPTARLNASFAHMGAEPGQLALLSQSGSIATAAVDWAAMRGIGFSQVVSLGGMADVDVGDYLDLLAGDGHTRGVLIFLESIPNPRKFLSAARALSRLKPVIVIKAGRSERAAKAAATHTGALSGADAVVEAALRRAGILRVGGLSELFSAAETVARFRPLARARLGIVTNGGGAGVLAVDRLIEGAGVLADLSDATLAALEPDMAPSWSRANPLDIIADASPERYLAALSAVAADDGVDVVLVMNCPSGLADSTEAARAVAGRVTKGMIGRKPVLSCWLGGTSAAAARGILRGAGVASYDNPATAAAAVGHLTNWGRAQAALSRVPDRAQEEAQSGTPADARERVRAIFRAVAAEGRTLLTEPEAGAALAAYGLPVPDLRIAATPEAARDLARDMLGETEGALVVKILSRDVGHKSDIGGVVLGVTSPAQAETAARGIARRLRKALPEAVLEGFVLQPMIDRREAQELIVGISYDPVFGPVILFGAGGVAVEVVRDTAIALPPLDSRLAADLISQTRVGALLAGYRGRPPADEAGVIGALLALSHMVEDFPCLRAVDVNPLIADHDRVVALDALIEIDPTEVERSAPNPHLAIRPYPSGWRRVHPTQDGDYVLRPILPADAILYPDFLARIAPADIRSRFLAPRHNFTEADVVRMSQLDYDREMAFVAIGPDGALAGVSRMSCDPDHRSAEYALLVRSDLKGRGLGRGLLSLLIDYAKADGLRELEGMVLTENRGMHALIGKLGFRIEHAPDDPGVVMTYRKL